MNELIELEEAEQDLENLFLKFVIKEIEKIKTDLLKIRLKKNYIKMDYNTKEERKRCCVNFNKEIMKKSVIVRKVGNIIKIKVKKLKEGFWEFLDEEKLTLLKIRKFNPLGGVVPTHQKIQKKISVENFVKRNLQKMIKNNLRKNRTVSDSGKKRRSRRERSIYSHREYNRSKEDKENISGNRSQRIHYKKRRRKREFDFNSDIPVLHTKLRKILSLRGEVTPEKSTRSLKSNQISAWSKEKNRVRKKNIKWEKVKKILVMENFPGDFENLEKIEKLSFLNFFVKELKSKLIKEQRLRMAKEKELEQTLMDDYFKVSKLEGKIEERCKEKKTGVQFDRINFCLKEDLNNI